MLRRELQAIVEALLVASERSHAVTLDAVGQAIGSRSITSTEIDAMFAALAARGRTVTGPQGGAGEDRLKAVVTAARHLAGELGRPGSLNEVADRAGLSVVEVRHALTLLQVMQR